MTTEEAMAQASAEMATISAKIRALHARGYSRSEIARFLQRHPTQVRNVIKADEIKRGRAPVAADPPTAPAHPLETTTAGGEQAFRLQIDPEGRITLPPMALKALGLGAGSIVIGRLQEDVLVLESTRATIRRLQAWVRSIVPDGVSLVDELIQERRDEARREAEGG